MRADEEFVKERLIAFLGETIDVTPGEDPPDYYFVVRGMRVAVEVTQLTPISFDKNLCPKNRLTEDTFSLNFCDRLDAEFKAAFIGNYAILIHICGPVSNARKFKKSLRDIIINVLADPRVAVGWQSEFEVAGNSVSVVAIPDRGESGKKIVGVVENKNSMPHIGNNAEIILADRILSKKAIMSVVPWRGPKWLALLNEYWLADHDTYAAALGNLELSHDFEKIFIISGEGTVHLLHNR